MTFNPQFARIGEILTHMGAATEDQVKGLIALESSPFEEGDAELLAGLKDCQFTKLAAKYPKETPKANAEPKAPEPVTFEDVLGRASADVQDMINVGIAVHNEQKATVIKELIENKRCEFTKEELAGKKLPELKTLAKLGNVVIDFSSKGGEPKEPIGNDDDGFADPMPTLEQLMAEQKA